MVSRKEEGMPLRRYALLMVATVLGMFLVVPVVRAATVQGPNFAGDPTLKIVRLNTGTSARLEILSSVAFSPSDTTPFTLECRVYGDDPVFDDYLFSAGTVQLDSDNSHQSSRPTVPCTDIASLAALNEDGAGLDEIYVRVLLHRFDLNGPVVDEARTNVVQAEFEQ
jgi:hypothetical protein